MKYTLDVTVNYSTTEKEVKHSGPRLSQGQLEDAIIDYLSDSFATSFMFVIVPFEEDRVVAVKVD